jgi:hypothetical protein
MCTICTSMLSLGLKSCWFKLGPHLLTFVCVDFPKAYIMYMYGILDSLSQLAEQQPPIPSIDSLPTGHSSSPTVWLAECSVFFNRGYPFKAIDFTIIGTRIQRCMGQRNLQQTISSFLSTAGASSRTETSAELRVELVEMDLSQSLAPGT